MVTSLFSALFGAVYIIPILSRQALAQSCWRNTTCSAITEAAFPGVWESNIYAPYSRTVSPKSVLSLATGKLVSEYAGTTALAKNGSAVVFDFGLEVGGIVTIKYTASGKGTGALGMAFTEAKNWIGEWSDSSNGGFRGPDGALYSNFSGPRAVVYTMPDAKLRGGFRYLTVFLVAQSASVMISDVSLEIGFQPTWSNLRAYQGYFHSNDEVLNAVWYSGAYTLQTNAVPPNTGRKASPMAASGWSNNGYLGPGDTIIVDGAKRDRAVWPGDMGVAVPSTFVSVGDLESVKNALQVMYDYQNADGSFPEAGPPLLQQGSDTYHMWTMIGTYNYILYTNDTAFLGKNWPGYLRAMAYIQSKVSSRGLLQVTGTRDWARWQTSGNMSHAQMILYRTLTTGASLALWTPTTPTTTTSSSSPNLTTTWLARASALQAATLTHCFDPPAGVFKDNATSTTLHPQDANSMAIFFGLVDPTSPLAQQISTSLLANWTPIGAATPELPGTISPFISSLEVAAHLTAGRAQRALDLVRRCWGWYLAHPNGTQSTLVEGFLVDGSFGYRWNRGYGNDPSYVSHAHGWSAGPTSALTEFVLGLRVTQPAGGEWVFWPQFGDLKTVRGGFTTVLGRFEASWGLGEGEGEGGYEAMVDVPGGARGVFVLPVVTQGVMPRVVVDGRVVEEGGGLKWFRRSEVGDLVVVEAVEGGRHVVVVS
ncbi:Six-hairpin glycosidase-like protein [Podospora appendiculata]|uniref:Six-hairpin glycosidase-like protein n=1 Tax=Podospora appendiculata TaxID=314037 RepID=A0AAE0XFI5_9PEZI|nr:Six-hairpin glycosidase-like protein [Podospora appendiculata]